MAQVTLKILHIFVVYTVPDFLLWRRWVKVSWFCFLGFFLHLFQSGWQYLADFFFLVRPDQAYTCLTLRHEWLAPLASAPPGITKIRVLTSLWMIMWITFAAGLKWQCKIWELLKQTAWVFHSSLHDHQPWLLRAFLPATAAYLLIGYKWYKVA